MSGGLRPHPVSMQKAEFRVGFAHTRFQCGRRNVGWASPTPGFNAEGGMSGGFRPHPVSMRKAEFRVGFAHTRFQCGRRNVAWASPTPGFNAEGGISGELCLHPIMNCATIELAFMRAAESAGTNGDKRYPCRGELCSPVLPAPAIIISPDFISK